MSAPEGLVDLRDGWIRVAAVNDWSPVNFNQLSIRARGAGFLLLAPCCLLLLGKVVIDRFAELAFGRAGQFGGHRLEPVDGNWGFT